jgi:hypothetical protein
MNELERILRALDERELARAVGKKHDDARSRYPLGNPAINDYADFERIIGDYYAYHFSACVGAGAKLPDYEAKQRAKQILEEEYRQQGQSINHACEDAMHGVNGGIRRVVDLLCEALKRENQANYIEQIFDTYVAPNSFDQKLELIRQLIQRFATILPRSVVEGRPEQYAHNYKQLVRAINEGLRRVARESLR